MSLKGALNAHLNGWLPGTVTRVKGKGSKRGCWRHCQVQGANGQGPDQELLPFLANVKHPLADGGRTWVKGVIKGAGDAVPSGDSAGRLFSMDALCCHLGLEHGDQAK